MNLKRIITIIVTFALFLGSTPLLNADSYTVYFPTSGNCYLCKLAIEDAVNKLDGITEVEWDYNTDVTTVTYNDDVTDPYIIMEAIALVGYDTEWVQAPDSSYNTLIGTCCAYERTFTYENVEIGYLSLMDLWIGLVNLAETDEPADFSIMPNAGNGLFRLHLQEEVLNEGYRMYVFSINGALHLEQQIYRNEEEITIGHLPSGTYIVALAHKNTLLGTKKFIKN